MSGRNRRSLGFKGNMAIGCLLDIVLIVSFGLVMSEERLITALAYAIIFCVPVWGLRWLLDQFDLLDGWCGRLVGPVVLVFAMLLSVYCPIKTDKPKGGEQPGVSRDASEKAADKIAGQNDGHGSSTNGVPHWELSPPPGIRYMPAATNEVTVEEALAELNGLVGLKPVKDEVARFVKFVRVAQQRKAAGLKVAPISYHMVFTGNPGTGKTTVARIMAKIYRALGVVKNGHLVECDRSGLVAGYAGQTAIKTGQVIDFALDGILFVDEAYSLVNGPQDSYGDEAISTLLKRMEDDRDRLVVIVAGYTQEMKTFIDANSGLASRFTHYVEFPDYTAEELAAMFRMNAKRSQYVLSADVEKWLDPFVRVRTAKRDRKFGNGRWARTLFEEAVSRQAVRVGKIDKPTPEQLKTLIMQDVGIKLKDPAASNED